MWCFCLDDIILNFKHGRIFPGIDSKILICMYALIYPWIPQGQS